MSKFLEGDEADLLAAGALERSYRSPAEWTGRADRAEQADFTGRGTDPGGWPMLLGPTVPRMSSSWVPMVSHSYASSLPTTQTFEVMPAIPASYARAVSAETGTPFEWAAAGVLVTVGSVISRRLAVRPDPAFEWAQPPVLWGGVVGEPGQTKSAVIAACRRLLEVFEAEAAEDYRERYADYLRAREDWDERRKVWEEQRRRLLKKDLRAEVPEFDLPEPEPPARARYLFGDFTTEAVWKAAAGDPTSQVILVDELKSLLGQLGRKGQETQRQFLLSAWNGTSSWTVDRKGDGTMILPRVSLSAFGSIQPDVLRAFLDSARTLEGNDGFFERLQLLVWPEELTIEEEDALRAQAQPETLRAVRGRREKLLRKLLEVDPTELGAEMVTLPGGGELGVLGFTEAAQRRLDAWQDARRRRQKALAKGDPLRAHLGKFKSLVPVLALTCHLTEADDLPRGPIGLYPLEQAIRLAALFELHAQKVYFNMSKPFAHPAWALGRLIAERKLPQKAGEGFTARDVRRLEAAGLRRPEEIKKALADLVGLGWLEVEVGRCKGRLFRRYHVRRGADHSRLNLPGMELDWSRVGA